MRGFQSISIESSLGRIRVCNVPYEKAAFILSAAAAFELQTKTHKESKKLSAFPTDKNEQILKNRLYERQVKSASA